MTLPVFQMLAVRPDCLPRDGSSKADKVLRPRDKS